MKYLFLAIILLVAINMWAQNLVPNPSFEEYSQCPDNSGQLERAINWINPTTTSPDYFHTCSSDITVLVPNNFYGTQNPHSGNAYSGIALYSSQSANAREYLQCQLLDTLEAGELYCIEFYMSLPDKATFAYTNNIGIHFSTIQPTDYTGGMYGNPLNINANVEYNELIKDNINWIKFSGLFNAMGGERYITIGNFQLDSTTTFSQSPLPHSNYIYVYIDDVFIGLCDENIKIPNIFTPNNDCINENFKIEYLPKNSKLAVYSRWGNIIYQSDNYQNNWDGENHPDGVYYYILTLPSGETKKGTVTILRN